MSKDAKKADGAGGGGKSKLIIIIVAAAVILGGGGGAWFFLKPKPEGDGKAEAAAPALPIFHTLQPITVNLAPENGAEHMLQVALTLQVKDQAQVDLLKLHHPQLQSRLLLLLSSKKASELATVEGKTQLQKDLIETVQKPFSEGGKPQEITDVLLTSFIVQ